jgi:hypothetical protein
LEQRVNGPTWREFEDFRDETRRHHASTEQRLWMILGSLVVLVVGYLFAQVTEVRSPAEAAQSSAASVARAIK